MKMEQNWDISKNLIPGSHWTSFNLIQTSVIELKIRETWKVDHLGITYPTLLSNNSWLIFLITLTVPPDQEGHSARRSKRNRVRPLEFWRNERAVYERRKSGGFALKGINSPEGDYQPYGRKNGIRRKKRQKGKAYIFFHNMVFLSGVGEGGD